VARDRDELDPTRVTNQPALTTSTGRIWLVVGGLLALISVVVLFLLVNLEPRGLATAGIVAVVLLYTAMVLVRLWMGAGRLRLGLLAACMIAMALIALVCVLTIAFTESNAVVS
jgi:hypothetical protein